MKPAEIKKKAAQILALESDDKKEKAIEALAAQDKENVLDAIAELSNDEDIESSDKEPSAEENEEQVDEAADENQEAKGLIGEAQGLQANGNYEGALKNLELAIEVSADKKMKKVAEANLDACKKAKKNYDAESKEASKAGRKAKKITDEDLRNDCNALIIKLEGIIKQEAEAGKNGIRYARAKRNILRLLRTALK